MKYLPCWVIFIILGLLVSESLAQFQTPITATHANIASNDVKLALCKTNIHDFNQYAGKQWSGISPLDPIHYDYAMTFCDDFPTHRCDRGSICQYDNIQTTESYSYALGSWIQEPKPQVDYVDADAKIGIKVTFTNGDKCYQGGLEEVPRITTLYLVCDRCSTGSTFVVNESEPCHIDIYVPSKSVCTKNNATIECAKPDPVTKIPVPVIFLVVVLSLGVVGLIAATVFFMKKGKKIPVFDEETSLNHH